jgi:enediyne biosynthesis protein E4
MFSPRVKRLVVLVLALVVCLAMLLLTQRRRADRLSKARPPTDVISPELLSQFTGIESREKQLDDTVWATERQAETFGASFDSLWDSFNSASNRFDVLASFPIGELIVGAYSAPETLVHGIEVRRASGNRQPWRQPEWRAFLKEAEQNGWQLDDIEFRQRSFTPASVALPAQSRISFRADVRTTNGLDRATLEGDLMIDWQDTAPGTEPSVRRLDATHVTVRSRRGSAPLVPILTEVIEPPDKWLFIDPLIVYDLDGDGFSEILLPGKNLLYRRKLDGGYQAHELCKYSPGKLLSAIVADFDGDGFPDLLCVKPEGLILYHGSSHGTFDEPGRPVWTANPPLKYAQVLTCGDVDHDGDLDVFLGQYKTPFFHGQMPSPFYDANDGDPAYLLLNDGKGVFTDATERAGLARKRYRRSYSGSLARLDGDTNMDLVVVSDFAGLDLYRNDGQGHFADVTRQWVPDSLALGMGHALADFNSDGLLDLFVIGMDSPTVDRLDHLGLRRPGVSEDPTIRSRLACGNRLLRGRAGGGFEQVASSDAVSHSGWSWGCSAFDFDNDGFPDLYIANGHESRATVREYEPEFWLHDIYVANSQTNRAADLYFQSKFTRTRARGWSYGGNEKNRLYLNRGQGSFLEAGYLLGGALEQDCRDVVSDDLDGDGRMDLLVTTFEVWPRPRQTLRVYRNTLADSGHWIGFRFHEEAGACPPVGVSVTIGYGKRMATAQITTGDSYRSQSPNTIHFGLADATQADWVEISWPDGHRRRLQNTPADRYYNIGRN